MGEVMGRKRGSGSRLMRSHDHPRQPSTPPQQPLNTPSTTLKIEKETMHQANNYIARAPRTVLEQTLGTST